MKRIELKNLKKLTLKKSFKLFELFCWRFRCSQFRPAAGMMIP